MINIKINNHLMGQKKEHFNLIEEHLKKRGITQTWLQKSSANFAHPLCKLWADNNYECLRPI